MNRDPEWEGAMAIGRTDEVLSADRRVRVRLMLDRERREQQREKNAADYIRQRPGPWLD